jgi:polyvinyl alcohol dehydrogenase (cytochrome)
MICRSCVFTSAVALLSLSVLAQNPGSIPIQTIPPDPNDWPMYNHDVLGTRFNPAEATLTRESVKHLQIEWVFPTKGDVYATPSVVNEGVYAGDTSGTFYALTSSGSPRWSTAGFGPITASALITNGPNGMDGMVIFGDQTGFIHGLDRSTGKVLWSVRPNPNPDAVIFGSPILVSGQVVIGISSNEGSSKTTFRGSVVSLDPNKNGSVNWQTYLITEQEQKSGSSGAGIWSSPTYDATTDTVYVTTGNNYTAPATPTSDAFVALSGRDGKIKWRHQLVSNDTGTVEADFGDSPQNYTLADGEKVVGAGEKNGIYWVLDATSGELVGSIKAVPHCANSEGLFADSAISDGVVFVNGVDCSIPANPPLIPPTGVVIALKSEIESPGNLEMEKLWRFTSPLAPVLSGVAVANGVVYFHTSGVLSILYALDAATGDVLARVPTNGGISGPSVSHGQIYVGTGTKFASGFATPTGIVAIGL